NTTCNMHILWCFSALAIFANKIINTPPSRYKYDPSHALISLGACGMFFTCIQICW
ncbi:Os03g0614901, partial [Oryza sativa Japonica Group]